MVSHRQFFPDYHYLYSSYFIFVELVCWAKLISVLLIMFQAVVLLIILISGLCCMMGIDTPTRFEAPVDS